MGRCAQDPVAPARARRQDTFKTFHRPMWILYTANNSKHVWITGFFISDEVQNEKKSIA